MSTRTHVAEWRRAHADLHARGAIAMLPARCVVPAVRIDAAVVGYAARRFAPIFRRPPTRAPLSRGVVRKLRPHAHISRRPTAVENEEILSSRNRRPTSGISIARARSPNAPSRWRRSPRRPPCARRRRDGFAARSPDRCGRGWLPRAEVCADIPSPADESSDLEMCRHPTHFHGVRESGMTRTQ